MVLFPGALVTLKELPMRVRLWEAAVRGWVRVMVVLTGRLKETDPPEDPLMVVMAPPSEPKVLSPAVVVMVTGWAWAGEKKGKKTKRRNAFK